MVRIWKIIGALPLLASAPMAAAHPVDAVQSMEVSVGDLDLQSEQGTATARQRIKAAAAQVCPEKDVRNLHVQLNAQACHRDARADGAQKLAAIQKAQAPR